MRLHQPPHLSRRHAQHVRRLLLRYHQHWASIVYKEANGSEAERRARHTNQPRPPLPAGLLVDPTPLLRWLLRVTEPVLGTRAEDLLRLRLDNPDAIKFRQDYAAALRTAALQAGQIAVHPMFDTYEMEAIAVVQDVVNSDSPGVSAVDWPSFASGPANDIAIGNEIALQWQTLLDHYQAPQNCE